MIKPHAMEQIIDPVLAATFSGNVQPVFEGPECDFVKELGLITLCGRYYRDLATVPYGDHLLQLFYGDKQDRRYFPMIQEFYRGAVMFLLIGYSGSTTDFSLFLESVKGSSETFDEHGELVTVAKGVRGALQQAYRYYSREASNSMEDETYEEAFRPVIQNFIHVCDTPKEVAAALTCLLSPHDLRELEVTGYSITDFMYVHQ